MSGGGDFLSDNSAGLCPEAVAALLAQQGGRQTAYSDDDATADAVARIREVLEADAEVFFVPTGTAANTLGIGAVVDRWHRVLCEEWAHFAVDESTGPEILTGARVTTIPNDGRKLTPDVLTAFDRGLERDVHHPMPGAVTISNATEHGEVYTPEETAELAWTARSLGYRFHLDGARFANAVYTYRPDFSSADYKEGVVEESDAQVTFEFYTPYIIAATPPNNKPWGIYDVGGRNGLVLRGSAVDRTDWKAYILPLLFFKRLRPYEHGGQP